jgi:hypothetical protein
VGLRLIRLNLQKGTGVMQGELQYVDRCDRGNRADAIGFLDSDMDTR